MKRLISILLVVTLFISCKDKTEKGKFTLNGEIKNVPDQKIYLEQLYFSQKDPEVLDTAEVKNGKFSLSTIAAEEGLFRLRLEKLESGFIFINDQPTINFKADINDVSLEGPIFNTPANAKLKNFLTQLNTRTNSLIQTSEELEKTKAVPGNDSLVAVQSTKLNSMHNDFENFIVKFIDTSSDPIVAMFGLGYTRDVDPNKLTQVVPSLAKRFPNHQAVQSLVLQFNQLMEQRNKPQTPVAGQVGIGSIAPDITMNDVNGKPFSLSSLKGKYVLVDFWASWCGPCRGENPNVVAAYNKYKNKNFTILGVSLDEDKNKWIQAIKEDKLAWNQISDLKGWQSGAVPLYGFDGIPYNVLIDPEGKIIATSLRERVLDQKLAEVLK